MAHNLNFTGGRYAYMGRQSAWHDLGTVTGKFFTWSDILAHGMLNFQVEKRQLLNPANSQPFSVRSRGRLRT